MRWMETLPTIQRLWPADRQSGWNRPSDPWHPQSRVNRTLNIALALLGLLALSPLLILVALLIKLTSRGPVLYTQVRIGIDRREPLDTNRNRRRERDLGGEPFMIYKFRTMRVDAEEGSGKSVV